MVITSFIKKYAILGVDTLSKDILEEESKIENKPNKTQKTKIKRLRRTREHLESKVKFLKTDEDKRIYAKIFSTFPQLTTPCLISNAYCLAKLMSIKETAAMLFVSPGTVKFHRAEIYRRLKIKGQNDFHRMYFEAVGGIRKDNSLPVSREQLMNLK